MTSGGPDFVAVPAMLLPAGSVMVTLEESDPPKHRVRLEEPTAATVESVANFAELMTPHHLARWSLQMLSFDPLLCGKVRAVLLERKAAKKAKEKAKARQLRATAVRREKNLRKRAAAKEEQERNLRQGFGPAAGAAGSSGSGAAAAGGCRGRGPEVAHSVGPAASAPPSPSGAAAAANLGPIAAAAAAAVEPVPAAEVKAESGSSASGEDSDCW
jgi:hypothetical protein